jgi:hypothetical protein
VTKVIEEEPCEDGTWYRGFYRKEIVQPILRCQEDILKETAIDRIGFEEE